MYKYYGTIFALYYINNGGQTMKKVILLMVLLISFSIANSQEDPQKVQQKKSNEKIDNMENQNILSKDKFIDKNADGIDDRLNLQKGNQHGKINNERKRAKDVFIDEDGDGICDKRATGLGFGPKGFGKMKNRRIGNNNNQK